MGPGGIVSDGCRGKQHESMLNFLFVEVLTGSCLYWMTLDMGSVTKDGAALAEITAAVKNQMDAAAGPGKVRSLTTDRARANVLAWTLLKEKTGLECGPEAVHVHSSLVGDVYKAIPILDRSNKEAYAVVEPFKKRAKLMSDFLAFQKETGLKPLTLIKARQERLGSKYLMSQRLGRLRAALFNYVHKGRFKKTFSKKASDVALRRNIALTIKSAMFWKTQKHAVKVLGPIVRSMRMCDSRLPGKAGLVYPSLLRMRASVERHAGRACDKLLDAPAAEDAKAAVKEKITSRIAELVNDKLKAATLAHPRNMLKAWEGLDGSMRSLLDSCRAAFYNVARQHESWGEVQNHAVEYLGQKGAWLDGTLLEKCKHLSLDAFWDEAAMVYTNPALKTFMVDLLSYVVDSADSERLWAVFQDTDPKGSRRSRLDFDTKEKEVGIRAAAHTRKYLQYGARGAAKRRLLRKTPSAALPIQNYLDVDLGGDSDVALDGDDDPEEVEADTSESESESASEGQGEDAGAASEGPSGSEDADGQEAGAGELSE